MEVVSFPEIRDELINNMRRKMLIPVIGSGFTKNCRAHRGTVPSGKDYCEYMISQIVKEENLIPEEIEKLKTDSFSTISGIYHEIVSVDKQKKYLQDHFTSVSIEESKKVFLSLAWPYIYTLNIDDGIEQNSSYKQVVYSNRPVDSRIFDTASCVIKLHGDIAEMLTYQDSQSGIFSQEQYVNSLRQNTSLLNRLNHDSIFQNLIFIGCSLDDEIDLLAYSGNSGNQKNITAKYICVVGEPTTLERFKYKKYGITHCIKFSSYDEIYTSIYNVGLEAKKISVDDLEQYKSFSIKHLTADYDANKPYLLFGKSLINKEHVITLPYFFISRESSEKIIGNMKNYPVQFLVGSGCSGKSYVLADIASKIKNRDVFFFQTKDRLTECAFQQLSQKKNCVIIADNTALESSQIEYYLRNSENLGENGVNVIIAADKNNRDLNGILKLYELQGIIKLSDFPRVMLNNTLSKMETEQINPLLTAIDVGIFDSGKTLIDNIIDLSKNLAQKSKYHNTIPQLHSVRELAALISLATERKIYSSRAANLELYEELSLQRKVTAPLIDSESTWSFEKDFTDNSPIKYVVNAEYWLCYQLEKFANTKSNYTLIVDAYKYIVARIIAQEGSPSLLYGNKDATYKDYILFDNINRIFCSNQSSGREGLSLIREIYEGLNELLSVDPNYMHQRAKCFIKSAYFEKNSNEKIKYLDRAYRDANVALQVFEHRYRECGNDKILISIAHIIYTQALAQCHKCNINGYVDIDNNTKAIYTLHKALSSPYNSYDFAKKDSFNYNNVIAKIVYETMANKDLIKSDAYRYLGDLFKFISKKS